MLPVLKKLELNDLCITDNGGMVYDFVLKLSVNGRVKIQGGALIFFNPVRGTGGGTLFLSRKFMGLLIFLSRKMS